MTALVAVPRNIFLQLVEDSGRQAGRATYEGLGGFNDPTHGDPSHFRNTGAELPKLIRLTVDTVGEEWAHRPVAGYMEGLRAAARAAGRTPVDLARVLAALPDAQGGLIDRLSTEVPIYTSA